MESIPQLIDIINNFFNTKNIQYVIGGSMAIHMMANMFSIQHTVSIHNLDIFYLANTPITNEFIGNYQRMQTTPHTSVTYVNQLGFHINLTMCRSNNMRFINYSHHDYNYKLMHPKKLMTYYMEEVLYTPANVEKLLVLNELIERTANYPHSTLTRDGSPHMMEHSVRYISNDPLVRRLFV